MKHVMKLIKNGVMHFNCMSIHIIANHVYQILLYDLLRKSKDDF